jgi:hypothetical protein
MNDVYSVTHVVIMAALLVGLCWLLAMMWCQRKQLERVDNDLSELYEQWKRGAPDA